MGVPPCVESRRVNGWESTETEGDGRRTREAGGWAVSCHKRCLRLARDDGGGGVAIDR